MNKKILAIISAILAFSMLFSLAGCQPEEEPETTYAVKTPLSIENRSYTDAAGAVLTYAPYTPEEEAINTDSIFAYIQDQLPELKTAIFTQNSYHFSIDDGERLVHATRFYDKEVFYANKEKLALQKRAKRELIDEAVKKLSIAKDLHDRLEDFYIKATDFDVINEIGEKILRTI
jgi:hypothetical protein